MNGSTFRMALAERAVPRGLSQVLLPSLLVAFVYYAGCHIGFALRFPSSGISFLWPPTAVLTSALLVTARPIWPALLIASFVAHAVAHSQESVAISAWPVQFLGNAVQALLAAYVIRRYSAGTELFSDVRRVTVFVVGASIAAPAIASFIPAYAYVNLGWADDLWQAWRVRAVSNLIASLTLIPPIITAYRQLRPKPVLPAIERLAEFALLLGLMATAVMSLQIERPHMPFVAVGLYAPVPFLLWASVRFGLAGLSCALLISALLTIRSAIGGLGPFVGLTPADTVVAVQMIIGVMAIPLMLIAGLLEEKRAEHRALVEVEQQNSAILRAIPDMMFLLTKDGVYLNYFARHVDELLLPPERFLGRNMREIFPPRVAARFVEAFELATTKEPTVIEYSLEISGRTRYFEARVIADDRDRILSIVRDITARTASEIALRESQQRYALATEAGGVGVWDSNLETGELYVGSALKSALGYADHEIPNLATAWKRLVHPSDVDDLESRVRAHVQGASAGVEAEHRLLHRDGSVRWFLTKGAIADTVHGSGRRMIGTYTDVTQRRRTERALKQANAALARRARITALGELTAGIAHEVNQPLCAIVANANACLRWLDTPTPSADLRGALNDVVQDSHRASEIIRRTRELFTNRPARKTPLNLNHAIRDVVELGRLRLQRTGIVFEMTLDDSLPLISADELQLQQVLLNLISNAEDAIRVLKSPGGVIHVQSEPRQHMARVSVSDTGRGFSRADGVRMFEPFYTTKPRGLGIGLAISRSIIKSHGGDLWATSNPQGGATFSFTIPILRESRE
jgi:PAS domain S-box-containing protein